RPVRAWGNGAAVAARGLPNASRRTPSPRRKAAGHHARIAGPVDAGPRAGLARADLVGRAAGPAARRGRSAARRARPVRSERRRIAQQTGRTADLAARRPAARAAGPGAAGI